MISYLNQTTGQCGCECGHLPYTMTVTFRGLPQDNRTPHAGISLASCFGSGAAAVLMGPGGVDPDNRGPISGIQLLDPGACYAKLGRVPPTLTVYGNGKGATFDVTLESGLLACDLPYWKIASVAVTGGTDYQDNVFLDVYFSDGDIRVEDARLRVRSTDGVPTNVDVDTGGIYYRESRDVPPIVAAVTATAGGGGTGATLTATVDSDIDSETFGQIKSLTLDSGGSDYLAYTKLPGCGRTIENIPLVLKAQQPQTLVRACVTSSFGVPPQVTINAGEYDGEPTPINELTMNGKGGAMARKGRIAPTLKVVPLNGSGATLTVSLSEQQDENGFAEWTLASVTTNKTGSGYVDNGPTVVQFLPGVQVEKANARIWTRELPTVTVEAEEPEDFEGSPAAFTATLERNDGYPPTWSITKIEIDDPGLGYPWLVPLSITADSPVVEVKAAAAVARADAEGKITKVAIEYGGEFYKAGTKAQEVQVVNGGRYYLESNAATPYVASVTGSIEQIPPSNGTGAAFSITIDDNPTSGTFGQAKALVLESKGSGYELLGGPVGCKYTVPIQPIGQLTLELLQAETYGHNRGFKLSAAGSGDESGLSFSGGGVFRSQDAIFNCDNLPQTLQLSHDLGGGSVTLSRGGKYVGKVGYCGKGCDGCDQFGTVDFGVDEIVVSISAAIGGCNLQGQTTLVLNSGNSWGANASFGGINVNDPVMTVGASLSCSLGRFLLSASVQVSAQQGWCSPWPSSFSLLNLLHMDSRIVDGKCVPLGTNWRWQEGQEINNLPGTLQMSVSATVVLK